MVLPSVAFPVINLFHRCIKTTTSFILPHRNITCTYCLIHICMKMNLSLFHFFSLGTGCSFLIFSLRGRMLLPLSTDGMEHLCIVNTEAWTKSSGRYYALQLMLKIGAINFRELIKNKKIKKLQELVQNVKQIVWGAPYAVVSSCGEEIVYVMVFINCKIFNCCIRRTLRVAVDFLIFCQGNGVRLFPFCTCTSDWLSNIDLT